MGSGAQCWLTDNIGFHLFQHWLLDLLISFYSPFIDILYLKDFMFYRGFKWEGVQKTNKKKKKKK